MVAFQSLGEKAKTMVIMPDAFNQRNKDPATASLPYIPNPSDRDSNES
jgi:hypothetical protein